MTARFHSRARANMRKIRSRAIFEVNIVPYLDVLLVLLVIFMIAAPISKPGVNVSLPRSGGESLPSSLLPVVVTVDITGSYYLNTYRDPTQAIDGEFLARRVKTILNQFPRTPVIVKADEKAGFGAVVTVMSLLKGAGATDIGLMTRNFSAPSNE